MPPQHNRASFNLGHGHCGPVIASVQAAYQEQSSEALLAAGASVDLDFVIDETPFLDSYHAADQDLTITVFSRIDDDDTWRQAMAAVAVLASSTEPSATYAFTQRRVAGSRARVRITNAGGSTLTRHASQVHFRSM
jgi:hypothetical protein